MPDCPRPSIEQVLQQHRAHAVIILDAEGRVCEWLAGAANVFGWKTEEILGQPLERLFTPEDRESGVPRREVEIATSAGEAPDDRWQMRKDGSRMWVEGVLTAIRDESGRLIGFVKVVRDRTDSRGETVLLSNRLTGLEDSESRRSSFLATLVHELRGPLSPLSGAASMIERLARSNHELDFPSRILSRQIVLLTRIVEDLVEMVRLSSGKLELVRETIDLNEAIRAGVESCIEQTSARDQALQALLPPAPTPCAVDPERIQQILVNLITNASKYTPTGGHIWVQLTIEGRDAVIRVRDDGIGIRPELQSRIFALFTQIPAGRRMDAGGLGLGLPLVRELVQLHGGSVQVHSEGENKGSEFIVKLPLDPHREVNQGPGR